MIISWDEQNLPINRIFAVQKSFVENCITTEYDSGRVVAIQKNTTLKKKYAFNYSATQKQTALFLNWYEKLGGEAIPFYAPSLELTGDTILYRMSAPPSIQGQAYKEISMEWIEA